MVASILTAVRFIPDFAFAKRGYLYNTLKIECNRFCDWPDAAAALTRPERCDYGLAMIPAWIIEKKRDGLRLDEEEIRFFVEGYTSGRIPDYQMSALAMAVYFRGMDAEETAVLTDAMMRSGDVLDLSGIPFPKVDKHSTGGIGDKTSLILAPWVACCGIAVPMISGRGLGITGGTLDKLESIPGYRTNLSAEEFVRVVSTCGCSIIGQTETLAPADRKLYALRDVTGTVPSIPLICASIMSKKLAEGIDALVLDVKCGRGAFMKDMAAARELGRAMSATGRRMAKRVSALITDMNEPLGRAAGNSVEVMEAVEALKGRGPADLMEVTRALAEEMLMAGGVASDRMSAARSLQHALSSGAALEKFREMVRLHGGDARIVEDFSLFPRARISMPVRSDRDGFVQSVDAEAVGRACVILGAGRKVASDRVDHAAGVTDIAKAGEHVSSGEALAVAHASDSRLVEEAMPHLKAAFSVGGRPVKQTSRILERLQDEGRGFGM